jgi:hypothetical protein
VDGTDTADHLPVQPGDIVVAGGLWVYFFASSWVYGLGSAANDAERGGIAKIFHLPVQPGDIDVAGRAGDGNSNWPAAMPAAADC